MKVKRLISAGVLGSLLLASTNPAIVLGENPAPPTADGDTIPNREGVEFFEQHIRPVLVERCYKCHAAGDKPPQGGLRLDDAQAMRSGGDSGPAVVPGKAEESLLLDAIAYSGDFYDMPPDGKLPPQVIANFRRWVAMGAPDPRKAASQTPATNGADDSKIGTAASPADLWVLRPLERPAVPAVSDTSWPKGNVDRFILANLERHKLEPAGTAERHILLRRVTYDLTGLPPTPQEIENFIDDRSESAWGRVVDRLLASPAFGDHWARHWFDLSCYADLADVQGNVVVQGAWRYRDYVIASLNADKAFDRFIAEQIAGDLLPYDSPAQQREQLIATGYLAIGPWALQNYVKQQLAADVVDHQIDKIGRTFLGMSVRCARCHDHKFDPIPTRDYYAMAGIFHSTLTTRYDGPGVWSQVVSREMPAVGSDPVASQWDALAANLKQQRERLEGELRHALANVSPVRLTEKVASATANSLTMQSAVAANDADLEYRVAFAAGPTVWLDVAQATAAGDGLLIQVLRSDGTVLVHHVHKSGAWVGTAESQELQPGSFTYRGDGSGDVTLHIAAMPLDTGRFGGAIDELSITDAKSGDVVLQEDFDDFQAGSITGTQIHTGLTVYAASKFDRWTGAGLNHSHAVDRSPNVSAADRTTQNIALQIFSGPAQVSSDPRAAKLQQEINTLASRQALLDYARPNFTHALAVQDAADPQDARVYIRGNFRTLGKPVPRGGLSAVGRTPFPTIRPGESGRQELAQWLTSGGNPATPRVLANRVWQHLFGSGLVRTVDYFGEHGDEPSNPELLDYLAIRFRDDGRWSLKALIRELVLSSTYRMSSAHDVQAAELDPDNRWLWRMNRRRLTAESMRDGMMAISGSLDPGRGGDPLGLEIPGNVGGIGDTVNLPTYSRSKIPDGVAQRRSVYLPLLRAPPDGPLEILNVFDFPHPSEITGQRPERTVATQALFLMNSPFVEQQARQTADLIFADPSPVDRGQHAVNAGKIEQPNLDRVARVQALYLRTLNRPAASQEIADAVAFVDEFKRARAVLPDAPKDLNAAAWTEFCRALFASNDFLFLE